MAAITKRENGQWQAKIRRRGWPPQSKTFRTKADAEAWSRASEREMDVGAFINRNDAERTTFAEAADRYAREVLPSKRGKEQDGYVLRRVSERFGRHSLASITSAILSAYRDERLKLVAGQTVVHELNMVSRIFKSAAMDWDIALPRGNPVSLVRRPQVSTGRTRRLEVGEEALLVQALIECKSAWPHAAFVLAVETAGRMSELLSLRWPEVDFTRHVIRLRGKDGGVTKAGDPFRDVPMSERAQEVLLSLPRSLKGQVLPISQNALQLSWERAISRARKTRLHTQLKSRLALVGFSDSDQARELRALVFKKREPLAVTLQLLATIEDEDKILEDLHFHDLRHEATSRLATVLAMHEVMKVTGHKSAKMLARYYQPRAEDFAVKLRNAEKNSRAG